MEQLVFKFVTDEKRKRLEEVLKCEEANLKFAENFRDFSVVDVSHRKRVVAKIKKQIAELK
jgi:hypothetical protein